MKVILIQNVPSLGKAGDLVKVNDGHARNLLRCMPGTVPQAPARDHLLALLDAAKNNSGQ